ncbi:MAG: protein-tyrosine-phosphatase [Bacteroidota bacterium]
MPIQLNASLTEYVAQLRETVHVVPADRQESLRPLLGYLQAKKAKGETASLTFICTHKSRRSHLGQIWAQTIADQLGVKLRTFSGGTEATACNPRTVTAMRAAGFDISALDSSNNPHYLIKHHDAHAGVEVWSKTYQDEANPASGFGAIMTCDSANEACPIVFGAEARFPILYRDPKAFDDTPQEAAAYQERCKQIAREMYWVLSQV